MAAAKQSPKKVSKKRVRDAPRHRSFKLSKKRIKQHTPLPGAVTLIKETTRIIWGHKRFFFGITLLYAIFSFIFVQGFGSSFQIKELQDSFNELVEEDRDQAATAISLFGYLLGSAGATAGEAAGAYQLFLILIASLAVIWSVRLMQVGERPTIRDALYKGMYPLVPFMMVLAVIALQLVPVLIGNLVITVIFPNGLAATAVEQIIWFVLFGLLALLSLYMVVSSLFALYIVTLPDMRPLRALRSARELVLHRRFSIVLRLLALIVIFFLLSALIFIPLLLIIPQFVELLFLVAVCFGLLIAHVYVYLLYRALI